MKIKRLEIKGFKSFPEKTTLDLKPGITSIVGPNGCGKSNVLEAIRWVMGEQRARILRGKRMEDVIFNGSDSRKPVGMAEVRLVLSNTEGLGPPYMSDYDEIMIGRRLFRDGESQYEINNVGCRLSDLTDFFLDTGVGRNSYAIIEQGRVDMVVASKPEDRRVLIEEAAGISRYKARREAAVKKLEQTKHNLLRISDVIAEVKRQNSSLKRQAHKAERYKETRDRLRELDLALHAHKCSGLGEESARQKEDLTTVAASLVEKEARCSSLLAGLEETRLKALQTERELKDALEGRHAHDLELTAVRGRIETGKAQVERIRDFLSRSEDELKAFRERLDETSGQHKELEERQAALRKELATAQTDLEIALEDGRAAEEELAQQKALQDRLKDEVFRTLQDSAQQRNKHEELARREREIGGQMKKIETESDEIRVLINQERSRREELMENTEALARQEAEEVETKESLTEKKARQTALVASLKEELASKEQEQAANTARLESLEELRNSYSSYDEGVRFVMESRESGEEDAILGPLAEIVEVAPEYQRALAAALGDRLSHLVVSHPRQGVEAARRLQEAGAGRSTFIPVSPRLTESGSNGQVPEGLIPLKEVVGFREGFELLGRFLLGRSYVVEDLEKAVEVWERNGVDIDLVTRDGEVLSRHGEISGGSHESKGEEIFGRRRQIQELHERSGRLKEEIAVAKSSILREESALEDIAEQIAERERSINELKLRQAGLRKDLEALETGSAGFERRLEVLKLEKQRLERETEGLGDEMRAANEKIAELEEQREAFEEQSRQSVGRVQTLTDETRVRSHRTEEIRVLLAQLQERGLSLEREFATSKDSLLRIQNRITTLQRDVERSSKDEKEREAEIERAQEREIELMRLHADSSSRIDTLKAESEEVTATLARLEKEAGEDEREVKSLKEARHRLELDAARTTQTLEALVEKIIERYGLDPRSVPVPEEPPQEQEISDLRAKLESMGEVNLAAIAECRYTEERLRFLLSQEEDLTTAVNSLYETIDKINRTTRERFRAAFDSINAKFQEIFPFLFRGGEARLELTDEENILETGVEIMARPPGKKIRNMDLLSGGEKALTAVALIFSIFLIRPSPFCLLDEVDAPLDESNVVRFNEMLRKLSDRTQFLVITHNKRTMEAADMLYGVTMEEPGASRVVSVEFAA